MKKQIILLSTTLLLCLLISACYSFRGISINPNANTFYVAPFEVEVRGQEVPPPPTLSITFTERLKDKIRGESRLNYKDVDPDIEFSGTITGYDVTAEAPQQGETTSFSRLTIRMSVEYIDNKATEAEIQKKTVSFFQDYPTDQNLLSIQDDLIDDINDELVDIIFNWAFNNW
ncbi:MAG: hypothetical protein ACI8YQ_000318 [Polaribacter sp.]|jgi:hypothetical protein